MNSRQRMLEQIRKSLEDHRASELQDNAFSYVSFLLRELDAVEADRKVLVDRLSRLSELGDHSMTYLLEEVGVNETKCSDHNPRQHRDAKPPWCPKCGLTKDFKKPTSIFDRRKD